MANENKKPEEWRDNVILTLREFSPRQAYDMEYPPFFSEKDLMRKEDITILGGGFGGRGHGRGFAFRNFLKDFGKNKIAKKYIGRPDHRFHWGVERRKRRKWLEKGHYNFANAYFNQTHL